MKTIFFSLKTDCAGPCDASSHIHGYTMCKLVLSDRRASLTPWMFECIMFLKVNKDHWTIEDTAMALKRCERKEIDGREETDFGGHQEAALSEEM